MQDLFWNFTIRLRMAAAVAMLVGLFAVIGAMVWAEADRLVILGTMAAMLAVVVPLTLINSASIVAPIARARQLADAITQGDLGTRLQVRGDDEAAQLLRALLSMQDAVGAIVSRIRDSTEAVGTASTQIAAGNQELSMRTEQTAGSLQQTASSMEQLTETVRQTADSAQLANDLANQASGAAQRGGDVMTQVVSNMEEISASSRKIAEIIGVIDGIAFQTNILALNAAVEAARAGEQGRGFAVVAGEVRNLAQRSAHAAKEIKALISASVDKVGAGTHLVHDAGRAMNDIVGGVQRVSDLISEITASTSEQSTELGRVSAAVSQLDQMTQQNAALVEESAAAADSLRTQAAALASGIKSFQVGSGASLAGPTRAAVRKASSGSAAAAAPKPAAPKPVPAPAPRPVAKAPAPAESTRSPSPAPAPVAENVSTEQWESF
ncbi:methyl-accepting chemotaxis protein [Sphaerotilus uruguayifluvii]|uniref:Methyl-accepting chemotaxis protein n=1 Tax=Sphaerotilus uruguayifluvii TaxID=2735897 RepID=A0ABX2G0I4_9BURK|nr:methyl-accepting chemotaxis protein [Leptothrix sp. C29]NRT55266.1 methyl-accepting chemotaxis protein [Leptothrix sp. C29]